VSNFASQFNRVIKGDTEREFTQQELTEFMSNDPMLWFEFKKELAKQQSFTGVRVPEILSKFIEERKEEIIRSGLAAAAAKKAAESEAQTTKRRASLKIASGWKSTMAIQGVSSMFSDKRQERRRSFSQSFVGLATTRLLLTSENDDDEINNDKKSDVFSDDANGDVPDNKSLNGMENTADISLMVGWGRNNSCDDEDARKKCQDSPISKEDSSNEVLHKDHSDCKQDSFHSVCSTHPTHAESIDEIDSHPDLEDDENFSFPTQRMSGSRRSSYQSCQSIQEEDVDDLESVDSIG